MSVAGVRAPAGGLGSPAVWVSVLAAAVSAWWLIATGLGLPSGHGSQLAMFSSVWLLMVPAIMVPATLPVLAGYARAVGADRRRIAGFLAGYAVVWVASTAPALSIVLAADRLRGGTSAALTTAILLAANGGYQLSPAKQRCLRACRLPVGLVLTYLSWRGPWRGVRAGVHHGATCLACCATLMVLMATVGMAPVLMAAIGLVVVVEKATPVGAWFHRGVGAVSVGLAAAAVADSSLVPDSLMPG